MERSAYGSLAGADMPTRHRRSLGEVFVPFFAEFLGTFLIVFITGVGSVTWVDPMWHYTILALANIAAVYTFGPVSGGHLNPATSLAAALAGKEPPFKMFLYVLMQLAGGLLAGLAYSELLGGSVAVGAVAPFSRGIAAPLLEVLYTMMLCFVVLSVCYSLQNVSTDQNHFMGAAVGLTYAAAGLAAVDISGVCLNPALALGLNISGKATSTSQAAGAALAGYECVGALLAAGLVVLSRRHESLSYTGEHLFARVLCEFYGTFMLVLTICLSVVMKSPAVAVAAAAALTSLTYATADVSGGHFNPAVTVAVWLSRRGKCPTGRGVVYIIVQILAGLLAGLLVAHYHSVGPYSGQVFGLAPKLGPDMEHTYSWLTTGLVEASFTALLAYTVLVTLTTTPPRSLTGQNFYFALAVGACYTAGGLAAARVTGVEMNPSVAVGLSTASLVSCGESAAPPWRYCIWFSLIESIGGVAAFSVFRLTHSYEFKVHSPHKPAAPLRL